MQVKTTNGPNLPGAWIVNPKDRGRKSIKNGKVYLDDNTEFLIEIHNPLKECILSDIRLNGQSISKTGLVIKPGQRIYLDCFVDDKKKFIFKTYEVENTSESKEAIEKNGLFEIFFYKEESVSIKGWQDRFHQTIVKEYYPVWIYPNYYPWYYPSPYYYPSGTITISTPTVTWGTTGITNISLNGGASSDCTYTSALNINCDTNTNANMFYTSNSIFNAQSPEFNDIPVNQNIETGRIEKGSLSNQNFQNVDMEFEKNYIHHIIYQLLPNSQKPVEASDLKRKFCEECGNKLRGTENFCPNCGKQI